MRSTRYLLFCCALLVTSAGWALVGGPVEGAGPPSLIALQDRLIPWAGPTVRIDDKRQVELRGRTAWQGFLAVHGDWHIDFDLVSERPRRMLGQGIPLLPGRLSGLSAADFDVTGEALIGAQAFGFLEKHRDLFRLDLSEWSIDGEGTRAVDDDRLQVVALTRRVDGVPVSGSRITMVIKEGALIYVHGTLLEDIRIDPNPAVPDQAALIPALGIIDARETSLLAPSALAMLAEADGADGAGRLFRLVWNTRFRVDGYFGTWDATVDAQSGALLIVKDVNAYQCSLDPTLLQGRVQGRVRPAQASDAEVLRYFPLTAVNDGLVDPITHAALPGTADVTDYDGWYRYSGFGANSTLAGRYFAVNCSGCPRQPQAGSVTSGDIDFGQGGTNQTQGTCPGNPLGCSTPADRAAFYHLNVAAAIGRKWLPANAFANSNVPANVNIAQTCNAFWNGASVNFFRSGGGCANTGEVRDVMQHEWGHGMDQNDGVPPPEGGTGEMYGDVIALFVDHDACIGQSFGGGSTGPYCETIPEQPFGTCLNTIPSCTGVRNIDEKRTTTGRLTLANVVTLCPPGGACAGPLGRECHCEGELPGQAMFHLANDLLIGRSYFTNAALPGANPAYSRAQAWYTLERLFFLATPIFASYAPSTAQNLGPGLYDAMTMIDDDTDTNPANGTRNAAYINDAFGHHQIAENPQIPDVVNCTPPANPVVTLTALIDPTSGNNQVRISWPGVPGAAFYNVYKHDPVRPDDIMLPIRQNIPAAPLVTIYDEPVQNAMTWEYSVMAVGANGCVSSGAVSSIAVALPEVDVAAVTTSDTGSPCANGTINRNETIHLTATLREVGGLVGATNISATLVTDHLNVDILTPGPVTYANLAAGGGPVAPSGAFDVQIGPGVPCNTTVHFKLLIESSNGCWIQGLSLTMPNNCTVCGGAATHGSTAITAVDLGSCADGDGIIDEGEGGRLRVTVNNSGTAAVTNVIVGVAVQTGNAVIIPPPQQTIGSIAPGGSANVTFEFLVAGAVCDDTLTFRVSIDSDQNLLPAISEFTATGVEQDAVAMAPCGFETGFCNWVPVQFVSNDFTTNPNTPGSANGGTHAAWSGYFPATGCDVNDPLDGGRCSTLTSPRVLPTATSQLTMAVWYRTESFDGADWWDRANVHVINAAGTHTLITPNPGPRNYTTNPAQSGNYGACHNSNQWGWGGTGTTWATATFNLSAYAGQTVQIEITYDTDPAASCEGLYVDDIAFTNTTTLICDRNACTAAICGNGAIEGSEGCDDGNTTACDGCSATCTRETGCGDGAVCGNEACDDGNTTPCDGCSATCTQETGCGDGAVCGGETCDDGNATPCDGCSATCAVETGCGDGAVCGVETCDDGNATSCDGCSATCTLETGCGDGAVCGVETCDDGNTTSCDGCSATCSSETGCGDGAVCGVETCDDGNTTSCDGCSATCALEAGCGDGSMCGAETCDDGNTTSCDGCSATCAVETGCGDGVVCSSEACDDGNTTSCDGCSDTCVAETGCGDGVLCGAEQCDDGNTTDGDGCSSTCLSETGGCAAALNKITDLMAVENAAFGIDFTWTNDPSASASEHHVNSVDDDKTQLLDPRRSNAAMTPECTVALPTATCTDSSVLAVPGYTCYQVLSACNGGVEEGPF